MEECLFTEADWDDIVKKHTTDVESLPSFKNDVFIGDREPDFLSLLEIPSHPDPFTLNFIRDQKTGAHLYFEENIQDNETITDKSISSFSSRPPAPESDGPIGAATGTSFWPGGWSSDSDNEEEIQEPDVEEDFVNNLLSVPPGFDKGIEFEEDVKEEDGLSKNNADVDEIIAKLDKEMLEYMPSKQRKISTKVKKGIADGDADSSEESDVDEYDNKTTSKFKWAIELECESEVPDFYTKIGQLAYEFPFELDPFQKQAILKLHTHNNVMIAAHTSAGKTVIAEYAIALSNHHMTKVIYTSPIKALSNQKFRDFKMKFGEVGLLTGDIQVNTDAPCLIMTTEILRSMLYNGSDITRDLEWVIFDEVHYINNLERGVVWEEVLIMLPEHVSVILLSATVANVTDFAEWVGNTKRKNVYVIKTPKRPVPLEHYLYTGNSDKTSKELFKIIAADDKNFNAREYDKAKSAIALRGKNSKGGSQRGGGPKGGHGRPNKQTDRNTVLSFVRMLERENKLPVVMFILSKARINELAVGLYTLDLTINKEKGLIRDFIGKCVVRLKGSDRKLPQILFLTDLMCRGIAVHHSGILPLIKEVTEMLFEKGLIKLLLATETFAMGINMPTRTVVFDAIEKFDGECKRLLDTSEYIQMAGRAGRRGLDETGTVIILCKGKVPEYNSLKSMVQGKATDLSSHFQPNYNMILSVLKGRDLKVEEMLKRSFAEYETQVKARCYKSDKKILEKKLNNLRPVTGCQHCENKIEHFYEAGMTLVRLEEEFQKTILNTAKINKSLHPGRLIIVCTDKFMYHLAVIVIPNVSKSADEPKVMKVIVLTDKTVPSDLDAECAEPWEKNVNMLKKSPRVNSRTPKHVMRPKMPEDIDFAVCNVQISDVVDVLNQKVSTDWDIIRKNLTQKKNSPANWDNTPIMTLAKDLMFVSHLTQINYDIKDLDKIQLIEDLERQKGAIARYSCTSCLKYAEHLRQTCEMLYTKKELDNVLYALSYNSLQFMPEFQLRTRVLRRLRYLGDEDQLKLKGKAACAMSTSELVITELVFDNFFKDLPVEEIVAILSCMVFQQRRCAEPELSEGLVSAKKQFLLLAHKIVEAEVEEGLRGNDAEWDTQFKFGLVEVVYKWALGEEFSEIMKYTEVDEGTIVRCITRLDEVLRCIKDVARIVGDVDFEKKMERASETIKRDIVFAASLYVQ